MTPGWSTLYELAILFFGGAWLIGIGLAWARSFKKWWIQENAIRKRDREDREESNGDANGK